MVTVSVSPESAAENSVRSPLLAPELQACWLLPVPNVLPWLLQVKLLLLKVHWVLVPWWGQQLSKALIVVLLTLKSKSPAAVRFIHPPTLAKPEKLE